MSITQTKMGDKNGEDIYLYTIDNQNGLTAEILNYGGIVRKLVYRGTDVVLGRDTLEEYFNNAGNLGVLVGRNSNRIENAEFEIDGKTYYLTKNEKNHNLHGGNVSFARKVWKADVPDSDKSSLVLSLVSPDGEEGFPGNAEIKVTYTLTDENSFKIHYEGICDSDTVLNMTNHCYFNLNGHSSGDMLKHTLKIEADFYTPNNEERLPTGEVLCVKGTPFDFTTEKTIGEAIISEHPQIKAAGEIDHNFVLNGSGYRFVCEARGDKSGIKMQVFTDRPGMQVYSMGFCQKDRICKDGVIYPKFGGFCLETQAFPNAMRFSHFPGSLLKKGEKYDSVTEYKFI